MGIAVAAWGRRTEFGTPKIHRSGKRGGMGRLLSLWRGKRGFHDTLVEILRVEVVLLIGGH